jgi:dihydrodipicolinate synthase/N-acetylneuraminate lyase
LLQVTNRFELDIPAEIVEVVGFAFAALLNKLYVALSTGEVVTLEDDEVDKMFSLQFIKQS